MNDFLGIYERIYGSLPSTLSRLRFRARVCTGIGPGYEQKTVPVSKLKLVLSNAVFAYANNKDTDT